MQLSHTRPVASASFDEPNLVSAAGLIPLMGLARKAGLRELGDEHLSVPTDKGAHAGLKLASLVAGMAAGADSIDDMARLRHGAMGKVFGSAYAPSTTARWSVTFSQGTGRPARGTAHAAVAPSSTIRASALGVARAVGCGGPWRRDCQSVAGSDPHRGTYIINVSGHA